VHCASSQGKMYIEGEIAPTARRDGLSKIILIRVDRVHVEELFGGEISKVSTFIPLLRAAVVSG